MRIVLVGRFPIEPGGFAGGVEASTAHLLEGLRELGETDLHLVAPISSRQPAVTRTQEGITYHYVPTPDRLLTVTWYAVPRRRIRAVLADLKPDIVHAQNSQVFGNICLGCGFPTVVSIHGIVTEELKSVLGVKARIRTRIQGVVLQRSVIRRATDIIQPTRYPESHFGHMTSARWHDTGNAVADMFFQEGAGMDRQHILYSGGIIRRKRLVDLIVAFAGVADDFPDQQLRVAGPETEPDYAEEVRAAIGHHGLEGRVEFLGLLDRSHLADEYGRCRVMVLPSSQETSPMSIMESMASSSAVIGTDVGGVGYLIDDGVSGYLVPVGDTATLEDRIRRILADQDLAVRMGREGHATADLNYRSFAVATRVRDVYRSILDRGRGVEP